MFIQLLIIITLSYLIGKTLSIYYENENENLKAKIEVLEENRKIEKNKYLNDIHMINSAFDNLKRDNYDKN